MGMSVLNSGAAASDDFDLPDDPSLDDIADLARDPAKKPAKDDDLAVDPVDEGGEVVDLAPAKKPAKPAVEEDDQVNDIEIVDDAPEADRGRKAAPAVTPEEDFLVTEAELQSYKSRRTQDRIQALARKGHEERRAKEEALRQVGVAIEYAKQLHQSAQQLSQSHQRLGAAHVESSKQAAEAEMKAAQQAYKEAFEAGDPEKVTDAQIALNRATIKLSAVPTAPVPTLQMPAPPVAQVSPRLTEWRARNQWFGQSPVLSELAMGFHKLALTQGIPVDSETYYSFIDRNMSAHTGGAAPASGSEQRPAQQASPPKPRYVAPVAASEPGATRTAKASPGKVLLTKSEVQLAKALGVGLVDYAREKQRREKGTEQ